MVDAAPHAGRTCPRCGTEYPPGIATCPQDGSDTVASDTNSTSVAGNMVEASLNRVNDSSMATFDFSEDVIVYGSSAREL